MSGPVPLTLRWVHLGDAGWREMDVSGNRRLVVAQGDAQVVALAIDCGGDARWARFAGGALLRVFVQERIVFAVALAYVRPLTTEPFGDDPAPDDGIDVALGRATPVAPPFGVRAGCGLRADLLPGPCGEPPTSGALVVCTKDATGRLW